MAGLDLNVDDFLGKASPLRVMVTVALASPLLTLTLVEATFITDGLTSKVKTIPAMSLSAVLCTIQIAGLR
jgi:hypothetical protein